MSTSSSAVFRAADFVDGIGVNTHLPYTDGAYANVNSVLNDLSYLGITHVRDWVINATPYPGDEGQLSYPVAAAAGIKFDMLVVSGTDIPSAIAQLDDFIAAHPGSVSAIEGPNEVNNWPVTYDGLSGDQAAVAFQNALYAAVQADPALRGIPVYNMTSYPELFGGSTETNLHLYPNSGAEPGQLFQSSVADEKSEVPGESVVVTEAGYYTLLDGTNGVDALTQAKLTLNLLFDAAKTGVQTTYLYQLLDAYADPSGSNSDDHYGLFDINNAPKPAATAIHNLTAILNDSGAGASSFSLTTPAYTTAGLTSLDSSLILEKASGATDFVFWSEPTIWNAATESEAAVSSHMVSLTFDKAYAQVLVYDPLVSAAPIETLQNTATVQLSLTDHPLIVEVEPGATTMSTTSAAAPNSSLIATNSILDGTGGDDTLAAAAGGATIRGLDGDDSLVGSEGNDLLNGNRGEDTINGLEGQDTLFGGQGSDSIIAGSGEASINGNMGGDTICVSGAGGDSIFGGQGDDLIQGGSGTGQESISGDLGNDTIVAGWGSDTLAGGAGDDVFVFASTQAGAFDTSDTSGGKVDVILGFDTSEQIRFTHVAPIAFQGPVADLATYTQAVIAAGAAFGTAPADVSTVIAAQVGADTYLFIDSNADQHLDAGDQVVKLAGSNVSMFNGGDFS